MTDNNKFIPKIPETRTEIVLDQEQQTFQEQKSTTEKAIEAVKETVVPTVHASEDKNKGKGNSSSSGRGSPKIVQKDTYAEAMRHASFEQEQARQQNLRDVGCELQ